MFFNCDVINMKAGYGFLSNFCPMTERFMNCEEVAPQKAHCLVHVLRAKFQRYLSVSWFVHKSGHYYK